MPKQCFVCLRNINLLHATHFQFIFCHCSAFLWQGRSFHIYFTIRWIELLSCLSYGVQLYLYFALLYITIYNIVMTSQNFIINVPQQWLIWTEDDGEFLFSISIRFIFINLAICEFVFYHMSSDKQYLYFCNFFQLYHD